MIEWLATPLTSDRVLVRGPRPGDEPALAALMTDSDVRRYIGGPVEPDTAIARAAAQVADPARGTFVIVRRRAGAVIGSGNIARKRGPWEISYQLDRKSWGHGLAREALELLTAWYFANMDDPTLMAVTRDANERSWKLLERAGATLTATFEQYGFLQRRYEFQR